MNLLTALSAVLSGRLLATALFRKFAKESIMKSLALFRKFAKESIMKSLRLLVKRRAKPLAKESINNLT